MFLALIFNNPYIRSYIILVRTPVNMSSGSWELVSRKKDRGNEKSKPTKAEKKKFIENAPKVEDFREFFVFCS